MTPEQIAAELSEAQRKAVLSARQRPGGGRYYMLVYRDGGLLINSLRNAGLVSRGFGSATLTPVGRSVRAILEKADDSQS